MPLRVARALVLVVLGGCAVAPPAPAATPTAPEASAPPAPPPPRLHAPTLPPLPPDRAPDRLGDPRSSNAARPWWGGPGYAPQSPLAAALVAVGETAPRDAGAIAGELLVCGVAVVYSESKFSPFSGDGVSRSYAKADLTTFLRFGGHAGKKKEDPAEIEARGPEDSNQMVMTVPVVKLDPGDQIALKAIDRDVFTNNDIEEIKGRYEGKLPWVLRGKRVAAECRLVPRQVVEREAAAALRAVDAAVAKFDVEYMPAMDDKAFFGRIAITRVTEPFKRVAALIGWDDPRLAVRSARMATLLDRFDGELTAEMKKLHAALPPFGAWASMRRGELGLRAEKLVCGEAALAPYRKALEIDAESAGCILHVSARNQKPAPEDVAAYDSSVARVDIGLVDRLGRRQTLIYHGTADGDGFHKPAWRDRAPVPAGGVVELLYAIPAKEMYAEPYFGPTPAPFAANVEAYEPLVFEASSGGGMYEKNERAQLRVK